MMEIRPETLRTTNRRKRGGDLMTTRGTGSRNEADRVTLNAIAASLDAMIGSGASSKAAGVSGADLRRDFGLVHKFLTAYDIGQPGLVDADEFDRLVAQYS
ncbi:hypothetical protein GS921_04370 [Rhodococcus hoagii]|nr:hypothetical protein [Prescottella equi]